MGFLYRQENVKRCIQNIWAHCSRCNSVFRPEQAAFFCSRTTHPPPRIHSSAHDILKRGQRGTVGDLLQLEGISLHPRLPTKSKSKDHVKENVRRMREIQKKCREIELENVKGTPKPVKALWKSQKYVNVESKVMTKLQENPSPLEPKYFNFLKAYSGCGSGVQPKRPTLSAPGTPCYKDEQENKSKEIKVNGSRIDFVAYNARNAKRVQLRPSRSLQNLNNIVEQKKREQEEYDSKQKGYIPQYLVDYKEMWLKMKEESKKNTPDVSTPPGHTLMPEAEKLGTLNNLKQNQEKLVKELQKLPLGSDTLSIVKRRTELEKKLLEVEEAIKIFSRPKVFIKKDS
ncbi:enkurin domain-containing protein 1 isoform X2 [Xenopus laevis]|uniref:Enkurin domain-containing protein 1 isoform X2 n=1 Tax=Xenopus laevis TaxID=8355 RepID=A0A8J0UVE2_XENLA|nr:enkurin domain-containing protein 1 isoform X2 [Xenopus laevis]